MNVSERIEELLVRVGHLEKEMTQAKLKERRGNFKWAQADAERLQAEIVKRRGEAP